MARIQVYILAALVAVAVAETSSPYPAPTYQPSQEGPYPNSIETTSHIQEPSPYYGQPSQDKVGSYPNNQNHDLGNFGADGYQPGGYGGYDYALQPGAYDYVIPGNGLSGFGPFGGLATGLYPVGGSSWGSPFSGLWDIMPYPRTIVSYAGKTVTWVLGTVAIVLAGIALTAGICTFTPLCSISFHGLDHIGFGNLHTIHDEMRSFMSPEKLNAATDFVKGAIDKYQRLQRSLKTKNNEEVAKTRR